ncbi:MAG: hypothetical protein WA632_07565 [Gallionella sp.]
MSNKGIVISGGQLNAQQIAVGDGATIANYGEAERTVLLNRISDLQAQIDRSGLPVDDCRKLNDAVNAVKTEANAEKPNRLTIETALSFIERATPSITAVSAAVKAVMGLVSVWFV